MKWVRDWVEVKLEKNWNSVWKSGLVQFFDPSGLRLRLESVHTNIDFTKNWIGLSITGLLRFLCGSTTGVNQFQLKLVFNWFEPVFSHYDSQCLCKNYIFYNTLNTLSCFYSTLVILWTCVGLRWAALGLHLFLLACIGLLLPVLTFIRLCWAALAFIGLRWPSLVFVGLHWSLLTFIRLCWSVVGLHWPSLGCIGLCWAVLGCCWSLLTFICVGLHWPSLTFVGLHWAVIGLHWPSLVLVGLCWPSLACCWPLLACIGLHWSLLTFVGLHWSALTFVRLWWAALAFIGPHRPVVGLRWPICKHKWSVE